MKRKDFFKAIGVMAITPVVIPSLLGKEPVIASPVKELSNPKGLMIDASALKNIPNALSPEEIIRIYKQTGNVVWKAVYSEQGELLGYSPNMNNPKHLIMQNYER